ncbi:MAG: Rmt family 16S rRNA (guanine(1405)-N(7))-methyltransferase [Clostridia bacterium]|nr:Rmt family 16S rRNA (guanine(1405)-N(7))-methyltransferase [Clostridia bacterium]
MSESLFEKLSTNKKYAEVCPDTIKRVISECEGRYKKPKNLEKAVREKLHGITSAFNDLGKDISEEIASVSGNDEILESILKRHASTRERLPLSAMDDLYRRIFEVTGKPESILDLACGLNPVYLAVRCPEARITGADISGSCVTAINALGGNAKGLWNDLLCETSVPDERFHMALLFKILPLLERQKSGSAMEVMNRIDAEYLVISFPTRTLGGRNVGMEDNYSAWMDAHMPKNREIAARFTTDNELYYILKENQHA